MQNDNLKVKKIENFQIDGNAEKLVWKSVQEITLFDAVTGKGIGKNKTKAKMMWCEKGLFVLWKVEDEHIWGTYKNDDEPIYNEEVVEIFIAKGEDDPRKYFEFQFSPLGVKFDAKISNPTGSRHDKGFNVDIGWDCKGLEYKVAILRAQTALAEARLLSVALANSLEHGKIVRGNWVVEVFIPWKSIGVDNAKSGDVLRANLFRIDGYPKQSSFQAWQPTLLDPPNFHVPAKFGFLELE